MSNVDERVKKIISKQFNKEMHEINTKDNFKEIFNADSLDIIELIMLLEEEFNIETIEIDINKIKTIQDIIDSVRKYILKNG